MVRKGSKVKGNGKIEECGGKMKKKDENTGEGCAKKSSIFNVGRPRTVEMTRRIRRRLTISRPKFAGPCAQGVLDHNYQPTKK